MRCKDVRAELALFVDGALDADGDTRVVAHLAGCAACAAEVAEIRTLLGQVQRARVADERGEPFWQDLARDIRVAVGELPAPGLVWWRRPAAWAGALAAAVAVAVALFLLVPRANPVTAPPGVAAQLPAGDDDFIDDEELALGNPAAAEEELEELELDDAAAARIEAAL